MRKVLYYHARQVTSKNGAAPLKGRPFFPRFLFCEKKSGAVRIGRLSGEDTPVPEVLTIQSKIT